MRKPKLYILSGLGADERVFDLMDLSPFDVTFIQWTTPFGNESIEGYAARLSKEITSDDAILVGLSFGGMVAVEVAKLVPVKKVILIASAKTRHELPWYFRMVGSVWLHRLFPTRMLKSSNFIANWLFSIASASDKLLFKQILADSDPIFFRWAIEQIVRWKNTTVPKHVVHIHGTRDRILPLLYVKADIEVSGAGHLMTIQIADELSRLLYDACRD